MPYPLTSDAIEATIQGLGTTFPSLCKVTPLPNQTNSVGVPPRAYSFLKIGKGASAGRPAMLVVAGLHAREWAPPDSVLTFAGKLLQAYSGGTDFTIPTYTDAGGTAHGPVVTSAAIVKSIIENMDIYLLPLANPDGRAFSMASVANESWRKNRSPLPVPIDPSFIGVDLNRNFDIAWDFDVYYSAAAAAEPNFAAHTKKDPSSDVYIGPTTAFSEKETLNVKWLLDNFPITFFMDLHSWTQIVMYPWAIETLQTTDPSKNFKNPVWDHNRDGVLGNAYQEYFPNGAPQALLNRHTTMVVAIRDTIKDATGANYSVGPSLQLYPCTGTSDDYAFSRQFLSAAAPTMSSFSIEFGDITENFRPSVAQFPKVEREVHAALIVFAGYVGIWKGFVSAVLGSAPKSSNLCFIATAVFGTAEHEDVRFLQHLRDRAKEHHRVRPFMLRFEAVYYRLGPKAAAVLQQHEWMRRMFRKFVLAPFIKLLRSVLDD